MSRERDFIRKVLIWISVMTLTVSGIFQINSQEVQAASASTAKKAYAAFLSKSVNWDGSTYIAPSNLKFGLTDINNDSIPELYVCTKKWNYNYDYKLYSYVNGKVKCIYSFDRYYKMGQIYASKGVFVNVGTGLKYGSTVYTYLKYSGGKVSKKAERLYSGYTGNTTYFNGTGKAISFKSYKNILQNLTGGAEYKKAPVLYDNTTANRNAKLNTKTSISENPVKFKVKKLWAFSNGGFYLNITSISGNKMKVSVHMPKMDRNNITAIIDSNGKKATAKFTCSDGERHTLTFVVSGNGIKVTEKSYCDQKLIGWSSADKYETTITHGFYPQSHFY